MSGRPALGAPDRRVAFAVPTGNFGNVYAGYGVAAAMGLPVSRLVVATNENDILARFFATGRYERGRRRRRPPAPPWTSRSPATSSACCSTSKAATASALRRMRPSRRPAVRAPRLGRARALRRRQADDDGTLARHRRHAAQHRRAGRSAHRRRPAVAGRHRPTARRADGRAGDGASRPSSPTRSKPRPASARRCRRARRPDDDRPSASPLPNDNRLGA